MAPSDLARPTASLPGRLINRSEDYRVHFEFSSVREHDHVLHNRYPADWMNADSVVPDDQIGRQLRLQAEQVPPVYM